MKHADFQSSKVSPRTEAQWRELMERYYDGATTPQEERELAAFLFSPQAAGREYEADRAVMAYALTGRRLHAAAVVPQSRRVVLRRPLRRVAAAVAVVLLLAGGVGGYRLWQQGRDSFSVSIHGEKYTRESVLEEQVRAALCNVFEPIPTPEEQLAIVFGSLDEGASPGGGAEDVSSTEE